MGRNGRGVLRLMRVDKAVVGVFILAMVLLAAGVSGCKKSGEDQSSSPDAMPTEYPEGLSADSAVESVAETLIGALDGGDTEILKGLVAVKAETEAVEAIYRRHGRTSDMKPEQVEGMVVAGWRASYAFLQAGETVVDRTSVRGDTAAVFASVKRLDGTPGMLKIKFIREDGLWKVRGGLESVSE